MSFGGCGAHKSYRSGGQKNRTKGEIFINTFQGKLAEYAVYQYFISQNINTNEPDISTFNLGTWDSFDLEINNFRIAVNSQNTLEIFYCLKKMTGMKKENIFLI